MFTVASILDADSIRTSVCVENNGVSVCKKIQSHSITCRHTIKNPALNLRLDALPFQINDNRTLFNSPFGDISPEPQDEKLFYSGSDDSDHRRPGFSESPLEQYFLLRILVRMRRWSQSWLTSLTSAAFYDSETALLIKQKPYWSRLLEQLHQENSEWSFSQSPVSIGSAEALTATWVEVDAIAAETPSFIMTLVDSNYAYAVVDIPFLVQYIDWNGLDRQRDQWENQQGMTLSLLNLVWFIIRGQMQEYLSNSRRCALTVQSDDKDQYIHARCEVTTSLTVLQVMNLKPYMTVTTLSFPIGGESPPDSKKPENIIWTAPLDSKNKEDSGGREGSKPKEKSSASKSSSRFWQAITPKKVRKKKDDDGDKEWTMNALLHVETSDIERLVSLIRQELHAHLLRRFVSVGRSRRRFAKAFVEFYQYLQGSGTAQASMLTYFQSILGRHYGIISGSSGHLESSRVFYYEWVRNWKKDWLKAKTQGGALDSILKRVMRDKRIVLSLIEAFWKQGRIPITKDQLEEIQTYIQSGIYISHEFPSDPVYLTTANYLRGVPRQFFSEEFEENVDTYSVDFCDGRSAYSLDDDGRSLTSETSTLQRSQSTRLPSGTRRESFGSTSGYSTLQTGKQSGFLKKTTISRHASQCSVYWSQSDRRSESRQSFHSHPSDYWSQSDRRSESSRSFYSHPSDYWSQSGRLSESSRSFYSHPSDYWSQSDRLSESSRSFCSHFPASAWPPASKGVTPKKSLTKSRPPRTFIKAPPPRDLEKPPCWEQGVITPDILETLDTYVILVIPMTAEELAALANRLKLHDTIYTAFDEALLRSYTQSENRLVEMMKQYVKLKTWQCPPEKAMASLVRKIREVLPYVNLEPDGSLPFDPPVSDDTYYEQTGTPDT